MIATAEEIANRIAKVTKSMHKDIIAMYVETILDELSEQIGYIELGSPAAYEQVEKIMEGVRKSINE